MKPEIIGLLAIPVESEKGERKWVRRRRAGIVFREQLPLPRTRFLDLDTLNPEPISDDSIAEGRMWVLDRRHASILAQGIDKARRRLRGQHVVFSSALSEQISTALKGIKIPGNPATANTAKAAATAGGRTPVRVAGAAAPANPGGRLPFKRMAH